MEGMKSEASGTFAVIDVSESKIIPSEYIKTDKTTTDTTNDISTSIENSLIQSPSIGSLSTFHDLDTVSELNMDQVSDLCVRIDNPQKHVETLETYITFRIVTKAARIEYSENEYVIRRRYNDFIWLRQKFVDKYPTIIIPPLPVKHSLIGQLDRYSKEFIFARMKLLNIFINRVIEHPILSCDPNLKVFLTAKPAEFLMYRKKKSQVPNKVSDSIQTSIGIYTVKNRVLEFEKFKEYSLTLAEKIQRIEKISQRINKEQIDYYTELGNLCPAITTWIGSEPMLVDVLHKISQAIDQNVKAQKKLISEHASVSEQPLRDFLMYIDVIQEVLHRRDNYQINYEIASDDLEKKRIEKDQLLLASQGQPQTSLSQFILWRQPTTDQKLEKLGTYIPQLVKHTETLQDKLECANEMLRSDIERWKIEKQAYLKKILIEMAKKQIEYYQDCVNSWEIFVTDVKQAPIKTFT